MLLLRPLSLAALLVILAGACSGEPPPSSVVLTLAGQTLTLGRGELEALPAATVANKGHTYRGVRLRDLPGGARSLRATGADGYAKELTAETVVREDALLAYSVDDQPLPATEGPLRLVIPNSPGLSVRQVVALDQL